VQNRSKKKKRGCKIAQLTKREGAKVQLNTKMGCKIAQKKRGYKIAQLAKDRGKVQLSQNKIHEIIFHIKRD
jgi:ribosomal protein S4E